MGKRNFTNKLISIIFLVMLALVSWGLDANALEEHEEKRVLFISSYSPSFKTFFQQVDGIKAGFGDEDVAIDIEFMDTKRFYTEYNIENFYTSLRYKIWMQDKYDAVIVADDNALNFAMKYQKELFNKIPIVFLGVNNVKTAELASEDPYITGIVEAISLKETIEVAKNINQDASNVVALTDKTVSGQGDLKEFYEISNQFKDMNFKDIDLTNYSFIEFQGQLQKLSEDDIVILLSVFRDKYNNTVTFDEGLELILANSNQPIYHLYYHGLGDGILGGKVISHYEQGIRAACMVNEIFAGKDIKTIACVKQSPNKYIFDNNILLQYGINEKLLPMDTIILNKKESFITQYFWYLVGISSVLLIQLVFIIFLGINIRSRKKSEVALSKSKQSLIESNEELTASLEELRVQDEKINSLIYCDSLTGLNNRFSIFNIIDRHIESEDNEGITGILFLDLDNFKNINDTYGHEVGDKVIKVIGEKLQDYQDEHINIGRLGGDEFIVLAKNQRKIKDIVKLVKDIQQMVNEKIELNDNSLYLTVSIGIVLYPDNGQDRHDLLKKVDLALYKAKELGKNTYVFYNESMSTCLEEKMRLRSAIKEAVKEKEFLLFYQPYVNAKTNDVIGFEALIRWNSDRYDYVSPYELIINAEEMGLMVDLGQWVLEEACKFSKKINEGRADKFKISVNVSAIQLMHNNFYNQVMDIVERVGISPDTLCLEMTETILIESLDKGSDMIQKFKKHGIGIALDDFGTGYSSLKYFKDLPVTILKIDKSFVDNIVNNIYDQNLINTMINIAHHKNVEVTAEGVELVDQLEILKKYDCDTIQGYLFSKPLSEEDTMDYIYSKVKV